MMVRRLFSLIALLVLCLGSRSLAASAELFVFEPGLERIVGYGVTSGQEFRLTLNTYQGPVTALWIREKEAPVSFPGSILSGQLRLSGNNQRPLEVKDFLSERGLETRLVVSQTGNRDPVTSPRSGSGNGAPPKGDGKTGSGDGRTGNEGTGRDGNDGKDGKDGNDGKGGKK